MPSTRLVCVPPCMRYSVKMLHLYPTYLRLSHASQLCVTHASFKAHRHKHLSSTAHATTDMHENSGKTFRHGSQTIGVFATHALVRVIRDILRGRLQGCVLLASHSPPPAPRGECLNLPFPRPRPQGAPQSTKTRAMHVRARST